MYFYIFLCSYSLFICLFMPFWWNLFNVSVFITVLWILWFITRLRFYGCYNTWDRCFDSHYNNHSIIIYWINIPISKNRWFIWRHIKNCIHKILKKGAIAPNCSKNINEKNYVDSPVASWIFALWMFMGFEYLSWIYKTFLFKANRLLILLS